MRKVHIQLDTQKRAFMLLVPAAFSVGLFLTACDTPHSLAGSADSGLPQKDDSTATRPDESGETPAGNNSEKENSDIGDAGLIIDTDTTTDTETAKTHDACGNPISAGEEFQDDFSCSNPKWRRIYRPFSNLVLPVDIGGSSSKHFYIVYNESLQMLHFEGDLWNEIPSLLRENWLPAYSQVGSSGPENVYVSYYIWEATTFNREYQELYRFDGETWTEITSPPIMGIEDILVLATDNVFLVGAGDGSAPAIARFDGENWIVWRFDGTNWFIPTSDEKMADPVESMWEGERPTKHIVGDQQRGLFVVNRQKLFQFETPDKWVRFPIPDEFEISAVSPLGPNRLFAAGRRSIQSTSFDQYQGSVQFWNGVEWKEVFSSGAGFTHIHATSESDVVVADQGIYERDGDSWKLITMGTGVYQGPPWTMAGFEDGSVLLAHQNGTVLTRIDGTWRWPNGMMSSARDVWRDEIGNLHFVGDDAVVTIGDEPIKSRRIESDEPLQLRSIFGFSTDDIYVGGYIRGLWEQYERHPVLYRLSCKGVTPIDVSSLQQLNPDCGSIDVLFGFNPEDLYALCNGHIFRFDGQTWRNETTIQTERPNIGIVGRNIAGSDPSNIWSNFNGAVTHFDGTDWNQLDPSLIGNEIAQTLALDGGYALLVSEPSGSDIMHEYLLADTQSITSMYTEYLVDLQHRYELVDARILDSDDLFFLQSNWGSMTRILRLNGALSESIEPADIAEPIILGVRPGPSLVVATEGGGIYTATCADQVHR